MNRANQAFVAAVERAITDADPIGLLRGGAPADEYSPEICTVVPRIARAERRDEVTEILHQEFLRWFGERTAGPRHVYEAPAARIWDALLEYRRASQAPAKTPRG
jgi:hypothetical protein